MYLGIGSYCLLHLAWISTSRQPPQARYTWESGECRRYSKYLGKNPLSTTTPPEKRPYSHFGQCSRVNRGRPVVLPGSVVKSEIAGEICVPRPGTIQPRSPPPAYTPRLDRAKKEAESFLRRLSKSRCTAASSEQRAKIKQKTTQPSCVSPSAAVPFNLQAWHVPPPPRRAQHPHRACSHHRTSDGSGLDP